MALKIAQVECMTSTFGSRIRVIFLLPIIMINVAAVFWLFSGLEPDSPNALNAMKPSPKTLSP